jgi:thiamine-phosphate pyrophosphorylase
MATPHQGQAQSPVPQLYLVTPVIEDPAALARQLEDALGAVEIAAVLLRLNSADERTLINRVKELVPVVQQSGAALVLDGYPEIVARAGADGAHLAGFEAFSAAFDSLKSERIVGCGGLHTKHDAMVAAERGADYLMFGEPERDGRSPPLDAVIERVEWWAEVFEVPCVGFAGSSDDLKPLAAAGADFIALGDWIWQDARGARAALSDIVRQLRGAGAAE